MAITPSSRRPWLAEVASTILLYAAATVAVVVTAQSTLIPDDPWVSGGSAITFLVGIFTLLAVRAQLRLGVRPLLSYSAGASATSDDPSEAPSTTRVRVELANNGLGPAVLDSVAYLSLESSDPDVAPPERPPADAIGYDSFISQIKAGRDPQFEQGRDFDLPRISAGGSLGPSATYTLGEFSPALLAANRGLAIWITYRGVLGPAYVKCIWIRATAGD